MLNFKKIGIMIIIFGIVVTVIVGVATIKMKEQKKSTEISRVDSKSTMQKSTSKVKVITRPKNPTIEWEYLPQRSNIFPALPIRFDLSMKENRVLASSGCLYLKEESDTSGIYKECGQKMTYGKDQIVLWAPMEADVENSSENSDQTKITFEIIMENGGTKKGTIHIQQLQSQVETYRMIYGVSLDDGKGNLTFSYSNEYGDGCVVGLYNKIQEADEKNLSEKNTQVYRSIPVKDKVCLGVYKTDKVNRQSYYVLDDQTQKILIPIMEKYKKTKAKTGRYVGRNYMGVNIVYKGNTWEILNDGSIYYDAYDGNETISYNFNNKELFETVLKIAKEDLGISPFEPKSIKNIKNADLTMAFSNEKSKIYKQTITDPSILRKMEEFLSNAQIMNGASACPFTEGLLKLTLEDGKEIKLAMATDDCRVFCVNGRYFEYKTQRKPVKGDSIWNISILKDYFSDIPWEH